MTKTKTKTLALMAAALGFATTAHAHFIWLEPAGGGTVLRFGEFADNLREASPGLLDRFGKPSATLVSAQGEKTAEPNKTASGFALPFSARQGDSIVAEDASFPLRKSKQGEQEVSSWYHPAARLITGFAAQTPKLTLDLVPTGQQGQFKLVFKGQPLAKTKVELMTQSGWSKGGYTDDQGVVKFDMPWKGQYVAEAKYADRTPGERAGEKYDSVNYVTSVTYVKAAGTAPIPAGPVKAPNK